MLFPTARAARLLSCVAAAGYAFAAPYAHGLAIPLVNPSFELPSITPVPGSQDPADFVLPFIDGWDETGPITNQQGFLGRLDTGVFINTPVDLGGGTILPPVGNSAGSQLAFMQVNPLADGVAEELVSISQASATPFAADTDYAFTIGIGPGVLFPPGSDDPVNNPATLDLAIGYHAPAGGAFVQVAHRIVDASELNPDASLKDFTVTAQASDALDAQALGNEIVVRVTQVGGDDGGFNLDKARLAVPVVGDTDFDGDVDDTDLGRSISNFTGPGGTGKTIADGDTDGDGDVDDTDLGASIANFTGPAAPPASVPEPASLGLITLGLLAGLRRRR